MDKVAEYAKVWTVGCCDDTGVMVLGSVNLKGISHSLTGLLRSLRVCLLRNTEGWYVSWLRPKENVSLVKWN